MPVPVSTILEELGSFLHDVGGAVWPSAIKLGYLNEAVKTVALLRPDVMATVAEVTLTADTPLQSIPTDGDRLLYVVRNVATGRPIRKIHREAINDVAIGWTPATLTEIDHYMFDEENPRYFYVYPVPDAALVVEIVYAKTPSVVDADSVSVGIPDIYLSPLKDFVLAKCFGMETKGSDYGKSTYYMQSFYNALGVKLQNESVLRTIQTEPHTRA